MPRFVNHFFQKILRKDLLRTRAHSEINFRKLGTRTRTRTGIPLGARDFKSLVSTNSTMRANLASPAGFEPATHSLEGCCSIQLS